MKLFTEVDWSNLLPYDGTVQYLGPVMSASKAHQYLETLLQHITWKNDEVFVFGKHHITKRKVAWYGDEEVSYTYAQSTKKALPWTPELLALKQLTEEKTQETYNSCLLNLYHNGEEGMSWHSDNEKSIVEASAIASLSFGATRKFVLKHKSSKEKVSVILEPGSLLVMKGTTQQHWLHAMPKTKKVKHPRVNLTFRKMV